MLARSLRGLLDGDLGGWGANRGLSNGWGRCARGSGLRGLLSRDVGGGGACGRSWAIRSLQMKKKLNLNFVELISCIL